MQTRFMIEKVKAYYEVTAYTKVGSIVYNPMVLTKKELKNLLEAVQRALKEKK